MKEKASVLRIWERDELGRELDAQRARGRRVVFTNGVFDLVHPGHARYLRAAKALGDVLVVALNDDASVRRLKGEKRPILRERERAKIIASLESVDYVTLFHEDTPREAVVALRPDVLVKGGDYTPEQIVGREEVEQGGGAALALELVPGASTSNLVARIMESRRRV